MQGKRKGGMKNNNKTQIDTTEKFQGGERFAKIPAWEVLERQVYLWSTRARRCIPLLPEIIWARPKGVATKCAAQKGAG